MEAAEIAARVEARRAALGWSRRAVARAAGMDWSHAQALMAGRPSHHDAQLLARLAVALGLPWDALGAGSYVTDLPTGPGRALAAARLAAGWSLRDLAARAGLSYHTIRLAEQQGRRPQAATAARLAAALGLEVDALR